MFERMEIVEEIYEGGSPSKKTQWVEAGRSSSGRKKMGVSSASPSNPKKGRAGKRKRNNAGRPSDDLTNVKNTCLLHGPGQSLEECKFLK